VKTSASDGQARVARYGKAVASRLTKPVYRTAFVVKGHRGDGSSVDRRSYAPGAEVDREGG